MQSKKINRNITFFKALKLHIVKIYLKGEILFLYLCTIEIPRFQTFLCAVKDLYHQELVAYDSCESQNMTQIYRVLDQLKQLSLEENAIFHTA